VTIDIITHKNLLITLLKKIYSDSSLAPYLGFKGGTAAMLFYNLSRFSVDLDFDLLDIKQEEHIFKAITELLQQYGQVKSQDKRYSLFFLLVYNNKAVGAQNIKVEINKRTFGSHYEVKQYLGITLQVMVKEDMVAHKLVAMHERIGKANRDIFDVWFFLSNHWQVNKKIIEERTHMSYKKFLQTCINDLESMGSQSILAGIGELLNAKQKAWAKTHLIPETIFLLKVALEHEN